VATLVLVSVLFGTTFVAIKVSVQVFSPVAVAALRLWLGAILVGAFVGVGARLRSHPGAPRETDGMGLGAGGERPPRPAWPLVILVGFLGYALPFSLVAYAETRIDAAMAGLLMAFGPVAALLLAPLLTEDEHLSKRRALGALLGCGGVALALGPLTHGSKDVLGGLCVVAAAVCYALAGFTARRIPWPTDRLTAGALFAAALLLSPVALLGQPLRAPLEPRHIWAMVYLGVLPTAVSYVLRFRLIVRHGYTFVSYAGYLVPVLSLLAGRLVLGETLSQGAFLALVLILAGIWVGHRPQP